MDTEAPIKGTLPEPPPEWYRTQPKRVRPVEDIQGVMGEFQRRMASLKPQAQSREDAFLESITDSQLFRHCGQCKQSLALLYSLSAKHENLIYDHCRQCRPSRFLERRYTNIGMPVEWRSQFCDWEVFEDERGTHKQFAAWQSEQFETAEWRLQRLTRSNDRLPETCFAFAWHHPQGLVRTPQTAAFSDLAEDAGGSMSHDALLLIGPRQWLASLREAVKRLDETVPVIWAVEHGGEK